MTPRGTKRTCPEGHVFTKSTDCPTCPVCEAGRTPADDFLSVFSAPARRALESVGIDSAAKLAKRTEKEILALHGMGKASLPKLRQKLEASGLSFRKGS